MVRVELIELPVVTITALAELDLVQANESSPVVLSDYFVRDDAAFLWRMRREQLAADATEGPWITRAVVDVDLGQVVGHAGYHGPPDEVGMVELGYSVDPSFRRRGYARAALEALLARAAEEPRVRVVRATISPDNEASRSLVLQYGFVEVGEQWDEEDGLEIIFEVPAK